MTDSKEPIITINGVTLTTAQSMTLRVAISSFNMDMSVPKALGDDIQGLEMAKLYHTRSSEILSFM